VPELSHDAKMIIASNLTVAAFIRDAAMTITSGSSQFDAGDTVDSNKLVTQAFAAILTNLEKQSLGRDHER
jgi:hypothetical protein